MTARKAAAKEGVMVDTTIQERLDAALEEGRKIMADMRAAGLVHIRTRWSEADDKIIIEGSPVPSPQDEIDLIPFATPFYARPFR